MMLVPTLCDLADALVLRDRVAAYSHEQDRQDRQNEGELSGASLLTAFREEQARRPFFVSQFPKAAK